MRCSETFQTHDSKRYNQDIFRNLSSPKFSTRRFLISWIDPRKLRNEQRNRYLKPFVALWCNQASFLDDNGCDRKSAQTRIQSNFKLHQRSWSRTLGDPSKRKLLEFWSTRVRFLIGHEAVVITLCLLGVGILLAGVFPEIPIPPGKYTNLHDLAGDLAFPSVVLSQFLFWRRLRNIRVEEHKDLRFWKGYKNYSLVSAAISLVFLFTLLGTESGSPYVGLAQRLFLAVPLLWIEAIAMGPLCVSRL
jgi:hypothetical protein